MEAGELDQHIKHVSSALPGAQSPLGAQGQTDHRAPTGGQAQAPKCGSLPSERGPVAASFPQLTEHVALCAESFAVTCSLLHNSARVPQLLSPRRRAHTLQQEKSPP